jgi:hypothetical protein
MAFLVILQLDAEPAPRHRMIGIASDAGQFAVGDFEYHRTGIGTVVGARAGMSCFHEFGHVGFLRKKVDDN